MTWVTPGPGRRDGWLPRREGRVILGHALGDEDEDEDQGGQEQHDGHSHDDRTARTPAGIAGASGTGLCARR